MKLVSVAEMRTVEQEADASGISYADMMENAGRGLADILLELPYEEGEEELEIIGLVGPGNNGGDALVAMAQMAAQGWRVRAYLIQRKFYNDPYIERLQQAGGEIIQVEEDKGFEMLSAFLGTATVVLDGVLGTGIRLPLKGEIGSVLKAAKEEITKLEFPPYIVAVDCPSGVDSDTGEAAEECIPADLTVTMAAVKQGLLRFPAFSLIGDLQVVDIGIDNRIKGWDKIKHEVSDETTIRLILPQRPRDAHKGTFGTALVTAGSVNYTGAAFLAGKAAYRVGAGLVTLAIPDPLHQVLAGQLPEATWVLLPHELGVISENAAEVLRKNLKQATALLIGPGFGMEDTTLEFILKLLKTKSDLKKGSARIGFVQNGKAQTEEKAVPLPPLVIDADGLKLLAKIPDWPTCLPPFTILTPHPGEMSDLTKLTKDAIQSDRQLIASKFAQQWGHIVVLKGAFTVVAAPNGQTTTIPFASAALARAGTGDVLAGIIVGLLAQGVKAYEAAIAGAWIHAKAGLHAAKLIGNSASVLAGDVLDSISQVITELE
ncbi:MAG: NAD(P)H-hydrate dehydratase [Anaerolineales bacterium]|nr:NAD(P)H-hydrate dehydratase [Anaerolineales bacterium]